MKINGIGCSGVIRTEWCSACQSCINSVLRHILGKKSCTDFVESSASVYRLLQEAETLTVMYNSAVCSLKIRVLISLDPARG
jgi:hypothetical protein